jgi:cyclohexanecarboxylate-CoA ligase
VTRTSDREAGATPLRVFACGGADVPPDLIRRATTRLGGFVTRVYGSTEYPTALSGAPGDPLEKCAGTDGRPIADAEARVVTADDRIAGPGVEGELQVHGPELFLGYLDERLNVESFTADGWFKTGDLAAVDEDGFVQITGRKKDIIIRGGTNIAPAEVERVLAAHAAVQEAVVIGIPDEVLGQRVFGFVKLASGAGPAVVSDILTATAAQLADFKVPERLGIVDDFPRNALSKVDRRALVTMALDADRSLRGGAPLQPAQLSGRDARDVRMRSGVSVE